MSEKKTMTVTPQKGGTFIKGAPVDEEKPETKPKGKNEQPKQEVAKNVSKG